MTFTSALPPTTERQAIVDDAGDLARAHGAQNPATLPTGVLEAVQGLRESFGKLIDGEWAELQGEGVGGAIAQAERAIARGVAGPMAVVEEGGST